MYDTALDLTTPSKLTGTVLNLHDLHLSLEIFKQKNVISIMEYTGIYERKSWIYRGEIALDGLALVFLLAVVVEKLVEIFKDIVYAIPMFPDKFRPLTLELLSLACGTLLAFQTNINAFDLLQVKVSSAIVGIATTGLVIGKGANFAHDFFQSYSNVKKHSP